MNQNHKGAIMITVLLIFLQIFKYIMIEIKHIHTYLHIYIYICI